MGYGYAPARPRVYLFVCGIFTFPGEARNWTGRAVTWVHTRSMHRAEKIEYFTGPLSRTAGEKRRAEKLARTISHYRDAGFELHLVGHSNGADVCLDALSALHQPPIAALHLIAPACDPDCDKSGLNGVVADQVRIYVGGRDTAMWLARTAVGQALGFGALGQLGPRAARISLDVVTEPDFEHATWFEAKHFGRTMERFLIV